VPGELLSAQRGERARIRAAEIERLLHTSLIRARHVRGLPSGAVEIMLDGQEADRLATLLETHGALTG
jgi:hypothetical protein